MVDAKARVSFGADFCHCHKGRRKTACGSELESIHQYEGKQQVYKVFLFVLLLKTLMLFTYENHLEVGEHNLAKLFQQDYFD